MKRKRAKAKKKLEPKARANIYREKVLIGENPRIPRGVRKREKFAAKERIHRAVIQDALTDESYTKLVNRNLGEKSAPAVDETRLSERFDEEQGQSRIVEPQLYHMGGAVVSESNPGIVRDDLWQWEMLMPEIVTDGNMSVDRIEFRNSKDETVEVIENMAKPQVEDNRAGAYYETVAPQPAKIGNKPWRPFSDKPITHYDYDGKENSI